MFRPVFALSLLAAAAVADDGATRADWPHYGGTHRHWRYSALDQIDASNVNKLAPVWSFQTGDYENGFQVTPIVVDGVIYVSTSRNHVHALDGASGKVLWSYRYQSVKTPAIIYGPLNRGVAIANGLVFQGTNDNHVLALDAATGREVWKVNVEDVNQCGCNITGAPLFVKDLVIAGVTGGDSAHRGYINAFDQRTGRLRWRFWTIPGPGEKGNDTWLGESWKWGGGSSWMTGSYDAAENLVYWSVGNPAADFYGDARLGANLYTDSVVALDADTGKLKWYHQQIPHDVWDFDTAYENILLDLPVKGAARKLLLNVNKGGVTWVVDRTTGKFVSGYPIVKHMNWIKGLDAEGNLVGRNEPVVNKGKLLCPPIAGGRSWNHAAFSPRTGWLYTTALEWCQEVVSLKEEPKEGITFMGGTFEMRHPPGESAYSHLDALDPITGERKWSYRTKYPLLASVLATAGDLVFTGDPEGNFFALNARTGTKLWSYQTGSGNRGSAISYSVNGRQFIATPSGWGSAIAGVMQQIWPETAKFSSGSTLFVFALPEAAR